jgi:hypothetical protein
VYRLIFCHLTLAYKIKLSCLPQLSQTICLMAKVCFSLPVLFKIVCASELFFYLALGSRPQRVSPTVKQTRSHMLLKRTRAALPWRPSSFLKPGLPLFPGVFICQTERAVSPGRKPCSKRCSTEHSLGGDSAALPVSGGRAEGGPGVHSDI